MTSSSEVTQKVNSEKQAGSFRYVIGGFLIFICFGFVFGAMGWIERTETPPLTRIALSQAACESINRSTMTTEIKNGICSIDVRYRKNLLNEGGKIEKEDGTVLMTVSSGQVISVSQLDDGSDQPWTTDHKYAIELENASWLMMVLIFFWMVATDSDKGTSDIPKKPEEESLEEIKFRLALIIEQDKNNEGVDAIILKYQWSRLKGKEMKRFGHTLHEFGAHVFVRFPDGREIELPGIGVRENYYPEID
jgi:hypothetical protein